MTITKATRVHKAMAGTGTTIYLSTVFLLLSHMCAAAEQDSFEDYSSNPLHISWQDYEVLAEGDFNGDGYTDMYLNYTNLGAGAVPHIWYGRESNGFDDHAMYRLHYSWKDYEVLAVGDFNGDGKTDIYLNYANLGAGAVPHIWYGRESNGFDDHVMGRLHYSWKDYEALAVGDFNGDGKTDIYLNYANLGAGAVPHIWYGRESNGFDDHVMGRLHYSWKDYEALAIGDFNGDGKTDIYLNYADLGAGAVQHIWYGRESNGFDDYSMGSLHPSWKNYKAHAVGDFDGDGQVDIYLNYANLGSGALQHIWYGKKWDRGFDDVDLSPLHFSWSGYKAHSVGDFDGDGAIDIYLNYPDLGAGAMQHIWFGKKLDDGFDDHAMNPLHFSWSGYKAHAVGDFDGDGYTDIYWNYPNLGANAVQHIWYGNCKPDVAVVDITYTPSNPVPGDPVTHEFD